MYSSIKHSDILALERNTADLQKLSSSVWTDKWLICLPKRQLWTAFLTFWSRLSRVGLSRAVCKSVIRMFLCKQLTHYVYSQLAMTGPEDGSNKQQCFSLYHSAISQYYGVNLRWNKVPTDPWAIKIMLIASGSLSRTVNVEWYHGFNVPQGL
jgi:hypothetical protein